MANVCYPEITPELLRQLLDYDPDTGILTWKPRPREMFSSKRGYSIWNAQHAGTPTGTKCKVGHSSYLRFGVFKRSLWAHRVAWAIHHGEWPDGVIDHINQNGLDNRISNLRDTNHSVNARNSKLSDRNKSGVTGVFYVENRKKWMASIRINGKPNHLGMFKTKTEAIAARKTAETNLVAHDNFSWYIPPTRSSP